MTAYDSLRLYGNTILCQSAIIADRLDHVHCVEVITRSSLTKRMVEMEGNDIENETLMDCIYNYPAIYDKSCKDYKVPLQKRNAWREVCMKLGMDVETAQKRYNNIRTMFSRYVEQTKFLKSGSGREDIPEARQDLNYLGWFKCHIKSRGSVTNLKITKRGFSDANSVCSRGSDSEDEDDMGKEEVKNNAHLEETVSQEEMKNSSELKPLESADEVGESTEGNFPSITPPPVTEKTKTSTSSTLQSPETTMAPKKMKGKTWSKKQKPMNNNVIDRQFMNTTHNMNRAICIQPAVLQREM